jgi:hypothetical protein
METPHERIFDSIIVKGSFARFMRIFFILILLKPG